MKTNEKIAPDYYKHQVYINDYRMKIHTLFISILSLYMVILKGINSVGISEYLLVLTIGIAYYTMILTNIKSYIKNYRKISTKKCDWKQIISKATSLLIPIAFIAYIGSKTIKSYTVIAYVLIFIVLYVVGFWGLSWKLSSKK